MSLNSFSQTDTKTVCLPSKVARKAAKELVRYDGCVAENDLLSTVVNKLEERDEQKDTIIELLNDKDENNQYIIRQQELQIGQYEHMTSDLQNEIKSQKTKSFLWKAATFLGAITTSYLLITK
jgi:hypothetical protein